MNIRTFERRASGTARGVVTALLGASIAVVAACHSSADSATLAELSGACSINSDCSSPLICAFQTCHQECSTSRDCVGAGLSGRCVESDRPYHVCLATNEASCVHNSDCPGAEVCGVDLQCRDACVTARDCIEGQVCTSGVCADPSSLVNGALPQTDADGGSCVYSTDCPAALVCLSSVCTVECVTDKDCLQTFTCQDTRCVPAGYTGPVPGQGDGGGASEGGAPGVGKACVLDGECQDGVFCNGVETCTGGHCAAGAAPCDDHSKCTNDTCNEAATSCAHTTVGGAPVDADGDGHSAIGCGTGDDCDDSDPHNFPGNPEVCDFRDNNCNGLVDESLWKQKSSTSSSPLPAPVPPGGYAGGPVGAPAVLALAGGSFAVLGAESFSNGTDDEGLDQYYAWLVTGALATTSGPTVVSPAASGSFDPDAPCGCEHATLEAPAIATDGSGHFAFGAEEDASCSQACDSIPYKPRAVGGVAGAGLAMPATFTFASTTDSQHSTGPAIPVWLAGVSKFAFVWRGEMTGSGTTTFLQTTTITGTAAPASMDGAHLLIGNDATSMDTALTPAQSTSSASVATKIATNGASIFVGWASATGKVRYALFDTSLTLKTAVTDLTEAEDVSLVDVLSDGSSFVLLTQDAMQQNARIRYVDASSGAAGTSAAIPGTTAGTTLHLTAQGSGFALIENGPGIYRIGWAPSSLALPENTSVAPPAGSQEGPFTFSDLTLTTAASGEARLVSIDSLDDDLFTPDGSITQISCGP